MNNSEDTLSKLKEYIAYINIKFDNILTFEAWQEHQYSESGCDDIKYKSGEISDIMDEALGGIDELLLESSDQMN